MKRFLKGSMNFWLILVVGSLFLLACDAASFASKGNSPAAQPTEATSSSGQAQAQPTKSSGSGKATAVPPAASQDASGRVSNSVNSVLLMDKKVLDSYHLEASGTSPVWNSAAKKVDPQTFTFKADVSGDNVHFISTTKTDKEKTSEGYIMGAKKDGGKGYSVEGGVVKEDLWAPMTWATLPLDYGMPLIFASMGARKTGEEAIDGHAADKFDVDMSKAPTGAAGMAQSFGFGMQSSKGTAWVDKQNGALLKMTIDYVSDVMDSGKKVGQGSGHIDWLVSQIGKVTVTLPPVSK
ncbi:MAG: hypothetical protein M1570_05575 [Chloroflexi bacterium]|nr:hypothetical protein [Chloroflexota bacterium]